mgnify:CR=1 FL=1
MITLDKTTIQLMGILDHNVTTQPMANLVFSDESIQGEDTKYASKQTNFNNSTSVILCSSPQQNYTRNIESLSIYNADTAAASTRIFLYESTTSTSTNLALFFLQPAESLGYEDNYGFYAMTSTGARK